VPQTTLNTAETTQVTTEKSTAVTSQKTTAETTSLPEESTSQPVTTGMYLAFSPSSISDL